MLEFVVVKETPSHIITKEEVMINFRKKFLMDDHVCPSWLYFTLSTHFRRWVHDPEKIFKAYVRQGHTAIDIGCGPGFFTLGLAGLVGIKGKVIAVDIQKESIDIVSKKIKGTRYEKSVRPVFSDGSEISVKDKVDFALTFWMLHEVPDKKGILNQVKGLMKTGALYLLVEPIIHVSEKTFLEEVEMARACGMELIDSPKIGFSRAALFKA